MKFENIEVGDFVNYNGQCTKVIMKDENRLVIDGHDTYITDYGNCAPICILSASDVEQMGYINFGENAAYRKVISRNNHDICIMLKRDVENKWNISVHIENKFGGEICQASIIEYPVKYLVQVKRIEEAFRMLITENL